MPSNAMKKTAMKRAVASSSNQSKVQKKPKVEEWELWGTTMDSDGASILKKQEEDKAKSKGLAV